MSCIYIISKFIRPRLCCRSRLASIPSARHRRRPSLHAGWLSHAREGLPLLPPLRPHALSLTLPCPTSVHRRSHPHRCLPLRHVHSHYVPVALLVVLFPAFWSVSPSTRLKGVLSKHRGGAAWPPAATMDASDAALRVALEIAQAPPPAPPAPPAAPVPSSQPYKEITRDIGGMCGAGNRA